MTLAHVLVLLGIGISVAANAAYVRDTLKGKTKPNRVTWFMWALAPIVGSFIAVYSGGDIWTNARVFFAGALPLVVFLVSFVDVQAYWKLTTFDIGCGALSFVALVLWFLTRQSDVAIVLAISADALASVPTLVKAWKYPETETGISFVLYSISFLVIFPAIPTWNVTNAAFQIYLFVINFALAAFIYRRRFLQT